eukprot:TRINITY_DN7528_c0_g1_i1.p1 TRINITY_DN7528_c0_g1~~TRINITY_DN7528_c0_g1_i1.p1  ORF type:complete len:118 (-),score=60.88 TRINITY_DN7528_c0_g1_i1:119-472(-)
MAMSLNTHAISIGKGGSEIESEAASKILVTGFAGILTLEFKKDALPAHQPFTIVLTPAFSKRLEGCNFRDNADKCAELNDQVTLEHEGNKLSVTLSAKAVEQINNGGVLQLVDYFRS